MSNNGGSLSRPTMSRSDYDQACNHIWHEDALAFLRSDGVNKILCDTFEGVMVEPQDLDGLPWQKETTSSKVEDHPLPSKPTSSEAEEPDLLGPVFGTGDTVPAPLLESEWIGVPSTPTCRTVGLGRPESQLSRQRKLSRSSRTFDINFTGSQEAGDPNPFEFVPVPSGSEEESDLWGNEKGEASIWRPPPAKRAFKTQELPPLDGYCVNEVSGFQVIAIGPPPGLPSPRPSSRPLESSVPFPTQS